MSDVLWVLAIFWFLFLEWIGAFDGKGWGNR